MAYLSVLRTVGMSVTAKKLTVGSPTDIKQPKEPLRCLVIDSMFANGK